MFSMTKSRELDEVQAPFYFVNRWHYGEDVKFYQFNYEKYSIIYKFFFLNSSHRRSELFENKLAVCDIPYN